MNEMYTTYYLSSVCLQCLIFRKLGLGYMIGLMSQGTYTIQHHTDHCASYLLPVPTRQMLVPWSVKDPGLHPRNRVILLDSTSTLGITVAITGQVTQNKKKMGKRFAVCVLYIGCIMPGTLCTLQFILHMLRIAFLTQQTAQSTLQVEKLGLACLAWKKYSAGQVEVDGPRDYISWPDVNLTFDRGCEIVTAVGLDQVGD